MDSRLKKTGKNFTTFQEKRGTYMGELIFSRFSFKPFVECWYVFGCTVHTYKQRF